MIEGGTVLSRTGPSPIQRDEGISTRCIRIWNDASIQIGDVGSGSLFSAIWAILKQTPVMVGEPTNWTMVYPSVPALLSASRVALAPSPRQQVADIQRWTGWSDRRI